MTKDEIRHRRESLNLTQAELAAQFGTDVNTVSRWEVGTRTPKTPGMLRLAFRALEFSCIDPKSFDNKAEALIEHNRRKLEQFKARNPDLKVEEFVFPS